jgi:hypothetical protein
MQSEKFLDVLNKLTNRRAGQQSTNQPVPQQVSGQGVTGTNWLLNAGARFLPGSIQGQQMFQQGAFMQHAQAPPAPLGPYAQLPPAYPQLPPTTSGQAPPQMVPYTYGPVGPLGQSQMPVTHPDDSMPFTRGEFRQYVDLHNRKQAITEEVLRAGEHRVDALEEHTGKKTKKGRLSMKDLPDGYLRVGDEDANSRKLALMPGSDYRPKTDAGRTTYSQKWNEYMDKNVDMEIAHTLALKAAKAADELSGAASSKVQILDDSDDETNDQEVLKCKIETLEKPLKKAQPFCQLINDCKMMAPVSAKSHVPRDIRLEVEAKMKITGLIYYLKEEKKEAKQIFVPWYGDQANIDEFKKWKADNGLPKEDDWEVDGAPSSTGKKRKAP